MFSTAASTLTTVTVTGIFELPKTLTENHHQLKNDHLQALLNPLALLKLSLFVYSFAQLSLSVYSFVREGIPRYVGSKAEPSFQTVTVADWLRQDLPLLSNLH